MDSGDGNKINCLQRQESDEKDALGKSNGFLTNDTVAKMPVLARATHYKMSHPRRGTALLFNHEHFVLPHLKSRAGTQVDCQSFAERLKHLFFDVEVYNDLNYKEIARIIEKTSMADHSENDCLLICVMSHGDMGILYAKDTPYKPENLWQPFTADKCPTLAGKPKLFFIQACQGDNLDKGITLSRTETDGQPGHSYRIPSHADFLIAYSTIPDNELEDATDKCFSEELISDGMQHMEEPGSFYSWRNTTRGSWFIQALCDELIINQYELDLLTMMTFVCQRVAIDYESNVPDSHIMHRQKQIPCITSMLTRLVLFTPKSEKRSKIYSNLHRLVKWNSKSKFLYTVTK